MDWTELTLTLPLPQLEAAEAACALLGVAYYLEDYSDMEAQVQAITRSQIIEEELLLRPRNEAKIHLYFSPEENLPKALENVQVAFGAAGVQYAEGRTQLQQEAWESAWKKYYHPIEIGKRLAVAPSWEEYESGRVVLRLDPGMAFGTGTHETTYMCLEWLDENIKGGEKVLDIGTGSGILGIAALLLGANSALGVDIEPLSVRIAKENAERNNVQEKFDIRVGDLAEQVSGQYDCITANIVADAIIGLAAAIPPLLAQDAYFIASGIIRDRQAEVEKAMVAAGLQIVETRCKKEWVAMLAVAKEQ